MMTLGQPMRANQYTNLAGLWHLQAYSQELNQIDYQELIQTNPALDLLLSLCPCVTWLFDVRQRQFLYVSSNVERLMGYSAQAFQKGGIHFSKNLLHPEDAPAVRRMTHEIWRFLMALPAWERTSYQFSRDYRLRRSNGNYVYILEQNTILQTNPQGNITHLLGRCTDISQWKKNDNLLATIQSADNQTYLLSTSTDDELKAHEQLSKREREIMKLVAEGYSSKQIAEHLCISPHTVNTHRHKMKAKTRSKNTSGLVQFAIHNGLI